MTEWTELVGGAVLLYFGAEWFVGGASALALALRVPQILVGLTVVAYGTSAPEIVVGVQAAATGHPAVALGNVIGSNIANAGLILGVAALVRPARVDGGLRRRELPLLLGATALVPLFLRDGVLGPAECGLLLLGAVAYTGWLVHEARGGAADAESQATAVLSAAEKAGAPDPSGTPLAAATAAAGLVVLLVGGNLFVDGAVAVAHRLGMSEKLVGLTVVAVGTSLPELVTGVIAARRGHSDIVVGNVIGSNLFNVLLCLGASGLAGSVGAPLSTLTFDLAALGLTTAVAVFLMRRERTITRPEGAVSLALYGGYVLFAALRG